MKYSEVLKVLGMTFNPPQKQIKTVFIRGFSGIGKTSLAYHFKAKLEKETGKEWKLIKQRVSDLFAEDFSGLPKIDEEEGVTKWYPPSFLPLKGVKEFENTQGILLLDELNRAKPDVLQAVMKILDRDGFLDSWFVMATGNLGMEDGTFVETFDAAQDRRFLYLDLEFDLSEWVSWALENNISPFIIEFLKQNPKYAYYEYTDYRGRKGYLTPAQWEEFDRYFKNKVDIGKIRRVISPSFLNDVSDPFWAFYDKNWSVGGQSLSLFDLLSQLDNPQVQQRFFSLNRSQLADFVLEMITILSQKESKGENTSQDAHHLHQLVLLKRGDGSPLLDDDLFLRLKLGLEEKAFLTKMDWFNCDLAYYSDRLYEIKMKTKGGSL